MSRHAKAEEYVPKWLCDPVEELPPIEDKRRLYEVIHDNVSAARHMDARLAQLARAFAMTGNDRVADELFSIGDAILQITEDARRIHGREQFQQTEQSRHMLGQTLIAAISVIDREAEAKSRIAELESQLPKEDA